MRSLSLLLLPLLVLSACSKPGAETAPIDSPLTIEGRVQEYMGGLAEAGFSGYVHVEIPSGPALSRGYGDADLAAGTAWDANTLFTVGSITKQFTATAILKLQMQGRLNTSDLISAYLQGVPEDKADITLHHLLTHAAGFPGAIGDDSEQIGRDAFVARAMQTALRTEPGASYNYSNVGYSLLAAVIERVSGQPYEAFLRAQLFEPAGMSHTGYILFDRSGLTEAVGYRDGSAWGRLSERMYVDGGPYWNLLGNGGILSTAADMLTWDKALKGTEILDDASKEQLFAQHIAEGPHASTFYGYGWMVATTHRDTRLVAHNGGNGIFFADFLRYLDEDVTILVATNRATRRGGVLASEIGGLVFVPGFEPSLLNWGAEQVDELPDHLGGEVMESLIELLTEGAPRDIGPYIDENFALTFMEMAPREDHLRIMGEIQQRLSGRSAAGFALDGARLQATLRESGAPDVVLSAEIGGDGKIRGLGVSD